MSYSFNTSTGLSTDRAQALWDTLRDAIRQIQAGNSSELRYEELYRHAYTLVAHKHGEMLYRGVQAAFSEHVALLCVTIRAAVEQGDPLETLCTSWESYHAASLLVRDVLLYLDRTYVKSTGAAPIERVAVSAFLQGVLGAADIADPVQQHLLRLISLDRDADAALFTAASAANAAVPAPADPAATAALAAAQSLKAVAMAKRPLVRRCVALYIAVHLDLTIYRGVFEAPLLRLTRAHYSDLRRALLSPANAGGTGAGNGAGAAMTDGPGAAAAAATAAAGGDVCAYLRVAEARLLAEDERVHELCHVSSAAALRTIVQDELIVKASPEVLANPVTGLVPLLREARLADLARLYRVFSRESAELLAVGAAMAKQVRDAGEDIVADPDNARNPSRFVERLLRLQEHYARIVTQAFKGDRNFLGLLREAIEQVLNANRETATYLSLYVDALFRVAVGRPPAGTGAPGDSYLPASLGRPAVFAHSLPATLTQQELEHRICGVLFIFRRLTEKDAFEEVYKQHLAGRLLTGAADVAMERGLLARLKQLCGHQFTTHFEGMLRDMANSTTLLNDFRGGSSGSVRGGSITPARPLVPTVLTTGFWPLQAIPCCTLPPAASSAADTFNKFYLQKFPARRLQWQAQLGTAVLTIQFAQGPVDLLVPTYQMVILLLFGPQKQSFTFEELRDKTAMPDLELRRHLLSLAHPRSAILKKTPAVPFISATDSFSLNTAFTTPAARVVTPVLSLASVAKLSQTSAPAAADPAQSAAVMEKRKQEVDAAIVRTLKTRKTVSHADLVAAVAKFLAPRFAVDTAFVKKRIEFLIEQEYVERDATDRALYHYLA